MEWNAGRRDLTTRMTHARVTVLVTSCPSRRNNTAMHLLGEPSAELSKDLLRVIVIRTNNERTTDDATSLVMCPCFARRNETVELSTPKSYST